MANKTFFVVFLYMFYFEVCVTESTGGIVLRVTRCLASLSLVLHAAHQDVHSQGKFERIHTAPLSKPVPIGIEIVMILNQCFQATATGAHHHK